MARYQSSCPLDCKVYVGGLNKQASRDEVERAFSHYGKLRNVFVARNPPGFAFVEFQDAQDALDAVRALDGRVLCGERVRVEISHGKSREKGGAAAMKRSYGGGGGGGGGAVDSGRRRRSRSFERRQSPYSSRSRERNGGGSMGAGGRDFGNGGSSAGGYRDSRRRVGHRSRSRS